MFAVIIRNYALKVQQCNRMYRGFMHSLFDAFANVDNFLFYVYYIEQSLQNKIYLYTSDLNDTHSVQVFENLTVDNQTITI